MGLLTPNSIKDFRALYAQQIQYLLSTENQSVKGLTAMEKHASDPQLKQVFQSHLQESQVQAQRLETLIAEINDGDADDKKDPIITALAGSAENITSESEEGAVRDAGLLATAQKIEHYEISSYGSARDWAQQLGLSQHADALQKTVDEEKHADQVLNSLSARINAAAAATPRQ